MGLLGQEGGVRYGDCMGCVSISSRRTSYGGYGNNSFSFLLSEDSENLWINKEGMVRQISEKP